MKAFRILISWAICSLCFSLSLFAQSGFEGILTSRVVIMGIDMSEITKKIDYTKGDLAGQMRAIYAAMPDEQLAKFQSAASEDPTVGMLLAMTPPQATVYVKQDLALAKIRGLGYEIEHYHNALSDEAFLYTTSLLQPDQAVTASYKPSEEAAETVAQDKRITSDNFTRVQLNSSSKVANYTCSMSSYTAKAGTASSNPGLPLRKLIVYSSEALPKGINFSHPFYLPEEQGIMRIDIYLDDKAEPTMIYEMTSVQQTQLSDELLVPKKTSPLYQLTDMNYGMQVLGIMMGGMSAFGDQENEDF